MTMIFCLGAAMALLGGTISLTTTGLVLVEHGISGKEMAYSGRTASGACLVLQGVEGLQQANLGLVGPKT